MGDFGTGRIQRTLQDPLPAVNLSNLRELSPSNHAGRTLSKGVGSLLWMAPEALRGSKVREEHASALDVYSYAIVLFEIWVRFINLHVAMCL